MNFIIRHQISELEEEIYEFAITSNCIKYVGWWLSKRKSIHSPFGYDWSEYYHDDKCKELDALDEIYGSIEEIDEYDCSHPKAQSRKEIMKKYNPCEQKVLWGSYSSQVMKDHPLKIGKFAIMAKALEVISALEIK